jgi:hypothetical protein
MNTAEPEVHAMTRHLSTETIRSAAVMTLGALVVAGGYFAALFLITR